MKGKKISIFHFISHMNMEILHLLFSIYLFSPAYSWFLLFFVCVRGKVRRWSNVRYWKVFAVPLGISRKWKDIERGEVRKVKIVMNEQTNDPKYVWKIYRRRLQPVTIENEKKNRHSHILTFEWCFSSRFKQASNMYGDIGSIFQFSLFFWTSF